MAKAPPLEINDFSGGITENILQGSPSRAQTLDNWLITNDKKLEVRYGLIPFGASNAAAKPVSGVNKRIGGMYTFINETVLMAQAGRSMFIPNYARTAWTEITGTVGPALQGGDQNAQVTYGEFQRQVYLTTDGDNSGGSGTLPSKIFRDTTNTWVARTAGLPRTFASPNYTNESLLSKCIANANALRTALISHMSDSQNVTFPPYKGGVYSGYVYTYPGVTISNGSNIHAANDKYSLNYLVAQTFGSTDPETITGVTAAPAATNQATLFTLVQALANALTHHINDANVGQNGQIGNYFTGTASAPLYHFAPQINGLETVQNGVQRAPSGPNIAPQTVTAPTTLALAATQLDDLLQKYNLHRLAVYTHSDKNDPFQFNKYSVPVSKIGTVSLVNWAPTITPDFTDLYRYVNNLKAIHNFHVTDGYWDGGGNGQLSTYQRAHNMPANSQYKYDTQIRLPDCTDLDSMYTLIYWVRLMYGLHYADSALLTHKDLTFDLTSGSTSLANVKVGGVAVTLAPGTFIVTDSLVLSSYAAWTPAAGGSYKCARVVSSGSGTAVMDRPAAATNAGTIGMGSMSIYHSTPNTRGASTSQASTQAVLATGNNQVGTDLNTWLTLANEVYNSMFAHLNDANVHSLDWSSSTNAIAAGNSYGGLGYFNTIFMSTGLPGLPFFIPATSQNAYAFSYDHKYTVEPGGVQYEVQSNPVYSASAYTAISYPPSYSLASQNTAYYQPALISTPRANVITNIPALVNNAETNYDTSNVTVNIWKTINGGTTFYLVDSVANGTTTYTDYSNDTLPTGGQVALSNRQTIYTSGGVVGSDQPPFCKYMHILNGTAYYGWITDSGQNFPNRIRQSVQFAPDWSPATFTDDFPDEITGLSSARQNLIVFCKNSIFRESGSFTQTGQGALAHESISDTTGLINAKSIIKTEIGVFFAGTDGFYYTDAYQIIKISIDLDKVYASLVASDSQKRAITAAYDKINRRIWWSMRKNATDLENNVIYVYHLNFGVKPSSVFTTASNLSNFQPASIVFQNGNLYMGHGQGFVLKDFKYAKNDAVISTTTDASLWGTTVIPYDYTSVAIDLGSVAMRKYLTKLNILGKNSGNVAMQPYVIKDRDETQLGAVAMATVDYNQNFRWGTPLTTWGDSSFYWKEDGKFDVWRRFPQSTMRANFVQIKLVPSREAIYSSSQDFPFGCNAVVDAVAKTATIQQPSPYTAIIWPSDVVGYYIAFDTDSYVQEFLITAVSTNVITFSDATNLSVSMPSGITWVIRGTKKEQRPTITSMSYHFETTTSSTQAYAGATSDSGSGHGGENPS